MRILEKITNLFHRQEDAELLDSGTLITKLSDGNNLVRGKQTWEHAKEGKDNIQLMKECCDAEIAASQKTCFIPAPFYFRRVAILSRKNKDYEQEIQYCSLYLTALSKVRGEDSAVQVGALADWFVKRKEKAESLYAKKREEGQVS